MDTRLGDVTSVGPVFLRERAFIDGTVRSGGNVTQQNGVTVTGGIRHPSNLVPPELTSWFFVVPATNAGSINLEPDTQRTLDPGSYTQVSVKSRATLRLRTGTYYLSSLSLEPQSTLRLDEATGPVIVYTQTGFTFRGSVVAEDGSHPDLLVTHLGTSSVPVEAPFRGTIVAPNAGVTLAAVGPAGHTGAFYAKQLQVDPDTTITYRRPTAILTLSGGTPEDCSRRVPVDGSLPPAERERKYQADVIRLCTGPEVDDCMADFIAAVMEDNRANGLRLVSSLVTPAQYLAVARDRSRKLRLAEENATWACAWRAGDADDDLVPDDRDLCASTPLLTATDDRGCPTNTLPPAPSADSVRPVLDSMGLLFDMQCEGALNPPAARPRGILFFPVRPDLGHIIRVGNVEGQPARCFLWFEVQVNVVLPNGSVSHRLHMVFHQSESNGQFPAPFREFQFNVRPGDPGDRGILGGMSGGFTARYRIRVMNARGQRSAWSDWTNPSEEDCLPGECGRP